MTNWAWFPCCPRWQRWADHLPCAVTSHSHPPAGITSSHQDYCDKLPAGFSDLVHLFMPMTFTPTAVTALKMASINLPSDAVLLSVQDSGSQPDCTLESWGPLKYQGLGGNPHPINHHLWGWEPSGNVAKRQPRLRINALGPIFLWPPHLASFSYHYRAQFWLPDSHSQ